MAAVKVSRKLSRRSRSRSRDESGCKVGCKGEEMDYKRDAQGRRGQDAKDNDSDSNSEQVFWADAKCECSSYNSNSNSSGVNSGGGAEDKAWAGMMQNTETCGYDLREDFGLRCRHDSAYSYKEEPPARGGQSSARADCK